MVVVEIFFLAVLLSSLERVYIVFLVFLKSVSNCALLLSVASLFDAFLVKVIVL